MGGRDDELDALRARVETLEAKMAHLFRALGISAEEPPAVPASERVAALVRAGDMKGAIRTFREETGASLKDAKAAVEDLRRVGRSA